MADANQILITHKRLLLPLLVIWAILALITIYFGFIFVWESLTTLESLLVLFLIFQAHCISIAVGCSITLNLIEQIESGRSPCLADGFRRTFGPNCLSIVIVGAVWGFLYFVLAVVDALAKEKNSRDSERELTFESATRRLNGLDQEFSWSSFTISALQKLIRMIAFLCLPAICWFNKGPIVAFREAKKTIAQHPGEFFLGYSCSGLILSIVALPIAIPAYLDSKEVIELSEIAWAFVFFYGGLAWSYGIFVEQLFVSELYLWHLKWRQANAFAKQNNFPALNLAEVAKPCLLDEIREVDLLRKTIVQSESLDTMNLKLKKEILMHRKVIKVICKGCSREMEFSSGADLQIYDYDLDLSNGFQIKCRFCSVITDYLK